MNQYSLSALISFVVFGMGLMALNFGRRAYLDNRKSKSGKLMYGICTSVFFWDFGYAWMSVCHNDDFAYIPRAIALFSIITYMIFTLQYTIILTGFPNKILNIYFIAFFTTSLIGWVFVVGKDAVTFVETPWGYWYTGSMSWARVIQFASVISAVILFYIIIHYGKKHTQLKRQIYIYNKFRWFGIILFAGYCLDTLVPILFHSPAIPGSCIAAFFSALLLYSISRNNRAFGVSRNNVAEYVFRDVKTPVLVLNWQGKIVLFNDMATEILDLTEQELLGHSMDDLFEKVSEKQHHSLSDVLKLVEDEEFRILRKNSTICKLSITTVKDKFDELLYSIIFVQDMTNEQKAFELINESRQAAEDASLAKSNFLANMSHEIRTPMNAIIGMSDILLQNTKISAKTSSQIQDIKTAGTSLLGIINDILDISKIEAGKYELIDDEYDLPSLLHDTSNIIGVKIMESKVSFEIDIDPTLPSLLIGDATRVRQILMNILGNAVKFTHNGSISLRASWNHDKENPYLYFDVSDTGIGMKEEDLSSIFGAFNQVDTRRNRNIQGTGLGLAISKHLAQMMDGDITVESVYGEGSTFHISVRQRIDSYAEIGPVIAQSLAEKKYSYTERHKPVIFTPRPDAKALVVDDNRINLTVAKGLLRPYGMEVDTALSGRIAIDMVQEKDYDIVFMDHMMPELDGIDTTKMIRQLDNKKYKDLVIIALTANAINDAKEMFLENGMQDFLAKPIEKKELNRILDKWL